MSDISPIWQSTRADGRIEIRATVTGFVLIVDDGKGGEPVTVPMHENAAGELAEWLQDWNAAGFDDEGAA